MHQFSDTDLLARLLRCEGELAERLLAHYGGLAGLAGVEPAQLVNNAGVPPVYAERWALLLELLRRLAQRPPRPIITTAADAVGLLLPEMGALKQEHLRVVLLDAHRRVIATPTVYIGSLGATIVRMAEVFRDAIAHNAASVIFAHNHPSGDPTPSQADILISERLAAAGKLLDIAVLDHLIIGGVGWTSLRETGVDFG